MLLSAVSYLKKPEAVPAFPVIVLFGEEAYLRAEVYRELRSRILGEEDAEFSLCEYEGNSLRYVDMLREVSTPPMFGGATRLIRVEEADSFVSAYTELLLKYLESPSEVGILLLQVKTLLPTSRFYKAADRCGLLIDLKSPGESELKEWLTFRARKLQVEFKGNALSVMLGLIGTEPGILDSELSRLALLAPPGGKLTSDFISENVGSWRLQRVWDLVDDMMNGDLPKALHQYDLLLASGEQPIGVFAQMAYVLRKFAAATVIYLEAERAGQRITPEDAVKKAKFYKIPLAAGQMKKLGRRRGLMIPQLLLNADLDLKGNTRIDPRIVIEKLMTELSSPDLR